MIAYSFPRASGNDAGSSANEGQRKLSPHDMTIPFAASAPGHTSLSMNGEQLLLARFHATLGHDFPPILLTNYYVSLKTNPLVVLTGPEGTGKAALVEGLATALLGAGSTQFVTIAGNDWTRDSSHGHYYRDLHRQFGSFSFVETLHEAAATENQGKIYLVLLKGLRPDELQGFFRNLLYMGPNGDKRLSIPGMHPDDQPIVPPNVLLTATLHVPRSGPYLTHHVLRNAGLIEVPAPPRPFTVHPQSRGSTAPPPVGFQRLMLQNRFHDPARAYARLVTILDADMLQSLRPSPELDWILRLEGLTLNKLQQDAICVYVANSFDSNDHGLFDPGDAYHNAQIAFDAQMIQRVLWQIPARNKEQLRWRLSTYLEANPSNW